MSGLAIAAAISFGSTVLGIATRPYETYRRMVGRASSWEVVYLVVLLALYCVTARISLLSVLLTYVLAVSLFWAAGRWMGARGTWEGLFVGWGYTLIPTLVWFWVTSLLYVLIPPPRTTSVQGMVFSGLYLLFCATLLFWKIILSYLALRFGLKLDLAKIMLVSAIVLPILGAYSIVMYRLGVFRIPFI
jgi:hypothetical protein